ncbi:MULTISPECIES: 4Fe-4S double cluster binding domain-containing protein [unclassified Fusibacter]|uniref:4Fe-4S double cluster binding domain-containing protein n=1 Tax=unclassified Fusibacter TaxID=2624464 RepID=UPI001011ABA5|nr:MULTISPECIES: 4Fe-4S double cluster binding domain-containing protein [unclassified Fusibacter]MCK8058321.1 4Fe-4S dicluster domain-containing protein [Fusibacter sp. A2]NPE20904.1 epoxyqueuosine reductase [Fusibacter sp. A1]RXV63108.1 epoxyqueuosine reductase [Fusibacter sp. A1]
MYSILENVFKRHQIDHWGFADLKGALPEDLNHYKTAVSFYVPMLTAVIDEVVDAPTVPYFHLYRTVNRMIDQINLEIGLALEKNGHRAYPIAASQSLPGKEHHYEGRFQHRTAARLAGLGSIGKSACFITPTHGPRVRLGTVLTTYQPDQYPKVEEESCGGCDLCAAICPAMAIYGVNWHEGIERNEMIDVRACSKHMHRAYQHIGRGVVCGLCFSVCPKGRKLGKVENR